METSGDDSRQARTVHHVQVPVDDSEPQVPFVETLAELRGVEPNDLAPLHPNVDHLVEHVLTSPPPEANQAEVAFTYEGYRVTLYHDGHAVFRDLQ